MQSILLSDNREAVMRVYGKETVEFLVREAGLREQILSQKEIREHADLYKEVRFIFSTWGIPIFTETEIRRFFPSLEAVFYAAGSVRHFARPFLKQGVRVFSAWAANAVPVAEYTVSQILLANKGFFAASRLQSVGKLSDARQMFSRYPGNYDVSVGIIGAGMIGSMVIEELKKHQIDVRVFDPFLSEERAELLCVRKCALPELFENCAVVSNHLADLPATKGMLAEELFRKMPLYATFINTGRGAQVVERDLVAVLTDRPDLTAILDVTEPEPPVADSCFYRLENCILTPHIAGSSGNEVHRMAEYMREEFCRVTAGKFPLYEVTEKMLETMA